MLQPMVIYFIWIGSTVPELYNKKYQQCLTHYGPCKILGAQTQKQLTKKYNIWHQNNTIIQRADVLRLLVMQQYGGIYLDFDVEVPDWNYLKMLHCEETYFCEEQIATLNERIYKAGNWMICSAKDQPVLDRLIRNIKPINAKPTPQQVLDYAGPGYIQRMGAKWMTVYPNVKHCYQNNWTVLREGCNTPIYHWIDYLGRTCVYLFSGIIAVMGAGFWFYLKRERARLEELYRVQVPRYDPADEMLTH